MGVTKATFNNLNQLTNTAGGGPIRFSGHLNETGTVWIGSSAATMGLQGTSFVGYAQAVLGTNVISIKATDSSNNSTTNNYQIVVTNSSAAKALTFDLNGNETSVVTATSTNTYEWDAADRLIAVNIGSRRSEFSYDGLGRRVRIVETSNGVVQADKRFLWCELELCEERDSVGASVAKRFFDQGEQVSGTNLFFTRDHLGSIREVTDITGAMRARYDYGPYGKKAILQGGFLADFGFSGHFSHQASGLELTLFRGYDPESGRWLNRDPIAEAGGVNLYDCVANNPVNFTDVFGLQAIQPATAATGPVVPRKYWSTVTGTTASASAVMGTIQSNLSPYVAPLSFSGPPTISNGAVYVIKGPNPLLPKLPMGLGSVMATGVTANSFTFLTLKGHVEAGSITFSATNPCPGTFLFMINSRAGSVGRFKTFGYDHLGGYESQTATWSNFNALVAAVATNIGGGALSNILIKSPAP